MLFTQKQKSISIFFIMSYFLNELKIYKAKPTAYMCYVLCYVLYLYLKAASKA